MSGLVGYGSSDEEDDDPVERPAKVAKTTHHAQEITVQPEPLRPDDEIEQSTFTEPLVELQSQKSPEAVASPAPGPTPGPAAPDLNLPSTAETPASTPSSPYTFGRQRLQELTMPTIPNFDIPSSPSPPPQNSEEAAALSATTKKFERFLELKKNGTHFNERLESTTSLRNPSLLPKLMEFAGISKEESYASTLRDGMEIPAVWPEVCSPENLVKMNERRNRKRMGERERVEFVAAAKSGASSKASTPKSGSGGEGRRSKFDRR